VFEMFLDSSGIVHMEFIPEEAAVNKHRYKKILRSLRNSIHHKCPELWSGKNWLLLYDNTPTHHSACPRGVAKLHVTVLSHPPYSPDLAPCDFFFFLGLKEKLHDYQFESAEEIVTATRDSVWDLPAKIFQQCFQQLYQCWQACIAAHGDYFQEGCGNV
jgi:histone-lysine N-methyltransferase SETMAR